MEQFSFFVLICFVNGACRANPMMYFTISKNEVVPLKNELIITSNRTNNHQEVSVQIVVDEIIHFKSHDVVTIDELICYSSNKSRHIIFNNLNFEYVDKYLTTNNTYYRYKSTQELMLRGSKVAWHWLCKLYAQWGGRNAVYEFELKVEMREKNATKESTSKYTEMPSHKHQVQLTKDRCTNIEHVKKICSNKTVEIGKVQPTEPKSVSSNTGQTSGDQKGKNQNTTEKNDGIDFGIKVKPSNTLKNVNGSFSHVSTGETSTSITWVIIVVVSVVLFMVGLVIGAICRRPKTASAPETTEQKDDQTDEHFYEVVVNKGIQNRPPLPIPEKAEYIYNRPYDHTHWFQNRSAVN